MIHQPKVKLQKGIYIYIYREREREREKSPFLGDK